MGSFNPALLAIVTGLSLIMLVVFLATGQQLSLTITAVLVTAGLAIGAIFIYGREEAREEEEVEEGDEDEQPPEAAPTSPDETPATRSDSAN